MPSYGILRTQWLFAPFIPGYSGGTAADFHRIPLFFVKMMVALLDVFVNRFLNSLPNRG
jgi:hypothetical protein